MDGVGSQVPPGGTRQRADRRKKTAVVIAALLVAATAAVAVVFFTGVVRIGTPRISNITMARNNCIYIKFCIHCIQDF